MRLSIEEVNKICAAVRSFCSDSAVLHLYGSRVDDARKGGDIDLLLIVSDQQKKDLIYSKIHYLLSAIKQAIGDQHIDFSVITREEGVMDPFFQMVLLQSLQLDSW
jgi:hypothetical protein